MAANQDNYVKAFTYRQLRALIGDGLLTSEGERWRRHRRVVRPLFSRRHVTAFGPAMTEAAQRLTARWDALAEGTLISVAGQMSGLALDIVGQALFGVDLSSDAELMGGPSTKGSVSRRWRHSSRCRVLWRAPRLRRRILLPSWRPCWPPSPAGSGWS